MKETSRQIYDDLPTGFHLHSPELAQADPRRLLSSSDEWEVLAGVLRSCQSGDFSPVARIPELVRRNDGFMFWMAAAGLLGYAGSWDLIRRFFEEYVDQLDDRGVQYFLAIVLADSCGLRAVEPLLTVYVRAVEEEPRYQIERHLSYLLEEEDGPLWAGARETREVVDSEDIAVRTVVDYEAYVEEVRGVRDEVVRRVGSTEKPVYGGKLVDVAVTARRLYERLTSHDNARDRIESEQLFFEAFTGVDCASFFDDENNLQHLAAAGIMETFLESGATSRFRPGQRYFFGHPVPS